VEGEGIKLVFSLGVLVEDREKKHIIGEVQLLGWCKVKRKELSGENLDLTKEPI